MTRQLATIDSLVRDLRALGVAGGTTLMVHMSLSALGYVNGGPPALIESAVYTSSTPAAGNKP